MSGVAVAAAVAVVAGAAITETFTATIAPVSRTAGEIMTVVAAILMSMGGGGEEGVVAAATTENIPGKGTGDENAQLGN